MKEKLKKLKGFLKQWNRGVYGDLVERKKLLVTQIGGLDSKDKAGDLSLQ